MPTSNRQSQRENHSLKRRKTHPQSHPSHALCLFAKPDKRRNPTAPQNPQPHLLMKTAISIIAIACLCACTSTNEQAKIQPPRTAYTAPNTTAKDFKDLAPEKQKEIDEYLARMDTALTKGTLLKEEHRDETIRLVEIETDDHLREAWLSLSHIKKTEVMDMLLADELPTKEQYFMCLEYLTKITLENEMLRRGILVEISTGKSPWKSAK